jgi:hypothetical protein
MKWFPCIIALFLVGTFAAIQKASAEPAESPEAVTQGLYHHVMKNPGLSVDIIKGTRPWLTPDLYAKLLKKAKVPTQPGDAGAIDCDVFLSAQDIPIKLDFSKASIDGAKAKVSVDLTWSADDKRHYVVLLTQVQGAWKVSDVEYDNKEGNLTDLLK